MSIPRPSRLGPYEVLAPLGAGGMGEVSRARDPRLGREVAIKVLPAHRLSDETKRRRFVQEARTASTLNHPSIVTIYEIERDGDVDFIVMELVHGKDLERSIPPRGMPLAEALRIAIPVADALARAHAAGIVHRDLKPANVVVSDEGVPKILDFGLAKLLESETAGSIDSTLDSPLSHAGTIAGTPGYMSPEQATGRSVDARSDVFSFGALLFEMVTGRRAFAGTTVPEALAATLSADPGPPSKLAQGVTEPLDRLILRCLRKDPDRRFQHMSDVRVELQEIAEEVAAGGSQGSLARVAAAGAVPPAARRRVWWWVAAAAAALLAAGAAAWYFERSRWRNPLTGAQFTRITDFDGTELDGAISRDGKFVAFLAARDGPLDTWVSQIGTGSFHNLTEGRAPGLVDEEVRNLGFSPDGALVYVWVRTAAAPGKQPINVWAVPTLGGPLRPFLEAAEVAWSPDGKQLVYHPASDGDPLHVSERDAGAGRRIYTAPSGVHCHYPTWSPNGAFIYFVRGFAPDQMDVWRIRPAGGEIDRLTFHEARVSHPNLLDDRTLVYIAPAEDGSGPSLYGMDVDERTPHRISFGIERYTSIAASADGRRLVATLSAPEASLWRLAISDRPIDASGPTRLPVRALSPRLGSGYLVYLKDDGKAIWKLEGDRASELWTGDGRVPAPPAVSPNGERIAFTMRRGEHTRLYAMNADGTGVRPLIEALEVRGGIAWSPDSEAIVVGVDQGNGPQLWHIPLADAAPRAVTTEYSIDPVWSPDGGSLVYSGSQLGPGYAVKAISLDGAPVPIPPLSLLRNDRFRFLPGGGALVLLKRDGDRNNFWRFDLATGSERRLTDFGPEYSIQDFDVSRDGKEIVFDRLKQASDIVLIDLPPR
ncbi:MAG TPA: protein kinase [Vicinamibacteria bacterium]